MKKILTYALMATPAIVFLACSALESRTDTDLHVYCQQEKYSTELKLYMNDTFRGMLPFSPKKFTCSDPAPKGMTLDITVPLGTYNVVVTDKNENVISKGMLVLTEDNMELTGQSGGMDARQSERCLYLEVL